MVLATTKIISSFKSMLYAGVLIFFLLCDSSVALAQSNAGCGGDTWIAMSNRAALVTRRQDMMNKRYIVKADSVLQYSCFDAELDNVVANVSPIFSNGEQWVDREVDIGSGYTATINIYEATPTEVGSPIADHSLSIRQGGGHDYRSSYALELLQLDPNTLEEALVLTVLEAYEEYIDGQFNHALLSGTVGGGAPGTLCYQMGEVWRAAKCKNFDDPTIFYRLEELIDYDPREFPPEMPCGET